METQFFSFLIDKPMFSWHFKATAPFQLSVLKSEFWIALGTERLTTLTFSLIALTTWNSSITVRSTHFRDGAMRLEICFLQITSNAMSGVNNPTLEKGDRENKTHRCLSCERNTTDLRKFGLRTSEYFSKFRKSYSFRIRLGYFSRAGFG